MSNPTTPHDSSPQQPQKKTSFLVIALAYVLGSCLGLGLISTIGSTGGPGIVIGLIGVAGCVALFRKAPRFRVPSVLAGIGCVLMTLIGLGSTSKRDDAPQSAAMAETARKTAEGMKVRQAETGTKLAALATDAQPAAVLALCDTMEQFGGVLPEHAERCGAALLTQGKAAVDAAEKLRLLNRSAKLAWTKKDEAVALRNKLEQESLLKAASNLFKESQAKLTGGDLDGSASAAKASRQKVEASLKLTPDDKAAADLDAKLVAHIGRIEKAVEKQAEAKRRERFLKESCAQVSRAFGPGSSFSDLQKEELWKKFEGKEFAWDLEVVEVSSGVLGGYTVQFKCGRGSPSLIQDIQMSYPDTAKALVIQFRKGAVYEIEGKLKHSSTLLGMTADPL